MVTRNIAAALAIGALLALPATAWAQDPQGQQGAVWNLGELAPGTYPSTVTAVNESCPGAHDFHVSILGEAQEFLSIIGPTVLLDIPPGQDKTSEVYFDLRNTAPGQHNEGQVAVRCVDCPFTCSQDYDILEIHLTVVGDANAAPPSDAGAGDPLWGGIDLTSLNPDVVTPPFDAGGYSDLRWIIPEALDRMTTAHDAVSEGLADLQFIGTGRPAGEIFIMEVTRNAETPFEMGFPLGTLIVPDDPAYSPMMVADNGAVALIDEVTTVVISGFLLDPSLQPAPPGSQTGGSDAPGWNVQPPPQSGPFASAISLIEAAYEIAGSFSTAVPLDNYFQVVVQRAIWADSEEDEDEQEYDEERLQQDILAQLGAVGKVATGEQVAEAADAIWNDISQVANSGKSR